MRPHFRYRIRPKPTRTASRPGNHFAIIPRATVNLVRCFLCFALNRSLLRCWHYFVLTTPPTPRYPTRRRYLIGFKSATSVSFSDDFGVFSELYVAAIFDNKVRILRNTERLGLIRSRLKGIRAATGVVVVVLDSHVEVQPGW